MAVGVFGILFFGDDFNLYFLNIRIWVLAAVLDPRI